MDIICQSNLNWELSCYSNINQCLLREESSIASFINKCSTQHILPSRAHTYQIYLSCYNVKAEKTFH